MSENFSPNSYGDYKELLTELRRQKMGPLTGDPILNSLGGQLERMCTAAADAIEKLLDGPKSPAVETLKGVLDEIEDYLEQRQDIKDGSDGVPQANTEMSLLSDLKWWRDSAGLSSAPALIMNCTKCGSFIGHAFDCPNSQPPATNDREVK